MKFKKIWNFIWHDDSFLSWIVNVIIALILVKFVIYPALGFVLGTPFPIVAVISGSMEHNENFDTWWTQSKDSYGELGITKENFKTFRFRNGFNKGDIMVLYRKDNIKIGDVIVFQGSTKEPIIHRIVKIHEDNYFQTKGDNYRTNPKSRPDELKIHNEKVYGEAVIKIPLLGWIKIAAVEIFKLLK